jgi:hypothetical protein
MVTKKHLKGKKSKKLSTHKKMNINRKIKKAKKKMQKEYKKSVKLGIVKPNAETKGIKITNSCPFKIEFIKQALEYQ